MTGQRWSGPRAGFLRGLAGVGLWLLVVGGLTLGGAGPAQAHAFLLDSDPAEGEILPSAPERIELTFSEAVRPVPDAVAVLDAEGEPVASTSRGRDDVLEVRLEEQVDDGTLVVVWRVVSADGHPVGGSLTFSVGAASAAVVEPPATVAAPDDGVARPPWILTPLRVLGYAGLLLAVGTIAFVLLFLPAAREAARARRRLVLVSRVAGGLAAGSWLLALPVVAAYQQGGGPGVLGATSTWTALPVEEYVVAVLVALGVVLGPALLGRGPVGRRRSGAALLLAGVAVAAPALTGHSRATTPELLVVGVDVLHLAAGAVWLGGLVGLALALGDLAGRGDLAAATVARFSTTAAAVLAVLVSAGALLSWRILGSFAALTGTAFGLLLLTKMALAAVAVGIAAWNRWSLLPRLRDARRRRERQDGARPVVRATAVEAAVLVVLVGVTGVLVDRSPDPASATAAAEAPDPAFVGPHLAQLGELEVQAGVSPHVTGPNDLTIQVRDGEGVPTDGYEPPRVDLATEDVDLGEVELRRSAPGTYTAEVVLPRPGTWELRVSLRTSEFENPVSTIEFGVS